MDGGAERNDESGRRLMLSSDDVDVEAVVKAKICRNAAWGYLPCQPSWRGCPFGRKPPQKPSECNCKDVTSMMWHQILQNEREDRKHG